MTTELLEAPQLVRRSSSMAAAASRLSASRTQFSAGRLARGLLHTAVVLVCACCLQGCMLEIPHHDVGNWRRKPDYLVTFDFVPPGKNASTAVLNSCSEGVPESEQCSGRGYCKEFNQKSNRKGAVTFCQCERDWADPECRTRRKSQLTTFLLSLFGGILGLDYFYLGFPYWGLAKGGTLGGFGLWWVLDVVRSGSGQVYAAQYRVAADLPHWIYVLSTVTLFAVLGFFWSIESYLIYRKQKRKDVMRLNEAEEARQLGKLDEQIAGPHYWQGSRNFAPQRGFSGYGATLPSPLPNGGAPYAVPPPTGEAGRYAGPYGPARSMPPAAAAYGAPGGY